ncbi:hypothetical protein K4K61_008034 [Colletotrichum sp. SAR11_59]|nr:hypothetical protein K4K61_008034 [Colletotrichum sp. SAR11_59]
MPEDSDQMLENDNKRTTEKHSGTVLVFDDEAFERDWNDLDEALLSNSDDEVDDSDTQAGDPYVLDDDGDEREEVGRDSSHDMTIDGDYVMFQVSEERMRAGEDWQLVPVDLEHLLPNKIPEKGRMGPPWENPYIEDFCNELSGLFKNNLGTLTPERQNIREHFRQAFYDSFLVVVIAACLGASGAHLARSYFPSVILRIPETPDIMRVLRAIRKMIHDVIEAMKTIDTLTKEIDRAAKNAKSILPSGYDIHGWYQRVLHRIEEVVHEIRQRIYRYLNIFNIFGAVNNIGNAINWLGNNVRI